MNIFTKHFWTQGFGSYILAIGVALTIRWAFMEAYVIPSQSMLPSLLINDHIFVNKSVYGIRFPFSEKWLVEFGKPQRGEVIVFKYPRDLSTFYIKRVVGVPGDKIYYEDGKLFINDKEMPKVPANKPGQFSYVRDVDLQSNGEMPFETKADFEHYIENIDGLKHDVLLRKGEYLQDRNDYGPIYVPEGQLFVMGDNRNRSSDSRAWNFVPYEYVLGRAMFVWLSCEEMLPIVSVLCNPLTIRWSRLLHSVHQDQAEIQGVQFNPAP
jgi:signal peptidase I